MTESKSSDDASEWIVVAALWMLAVGGSAYLILPSSIAPTIQHDLAIGAAAVGWLISIPYAAEVLASMPTGAVLSRVDRRRVLAAAVLSLTVSCFWGWHAGATGNYWSFLASRFFGGAAFAVLWIASIDLVTQEISENVTTAVAIYTTSGPAGLAVGLAAAPVLARLADWPGTFAISGLVIGALLLVTWPVLPQLPLDRSTAVTSETTQPGMGVIISAVTTDRTALLVGVLSFSAFSLLLFFTSWMPSYLSVTFGLTLERSGLFVALFPAVGILARSGGGLLSDRVFEGRRRPVVRLSFFVALPLVIAIAMASEILLVLLFIVAGGFFIQLSIGVFFTYGAEIETDYPNSAFVAFLTMTGLSGSFTAPIIAGVLIDLTGTFTAAFVYAMMLAFVGTLAALTVRSPQTDV